EAHLAMCAECRAIRDELARVVARAKLIEYREPKTDLWGSIESTIAVTPRGLPKQRVITMSLWRLAAAAAVVALLAGGFAWTIATRRTAIVVADTPDRDTVVTAVASTATNSSAIAIASYREAAADLQRAFEAGRGTLRPETMRVIEDNLRAMDVA